MSREMRAVFTEKLREFMTADERVMVIDADLARASGTLALKEQFPDRAIDVGVAEANMVSVAAGLASYGFLPFCTTFAPFVARRACDQVALSVAYAKQNVKLVGTDPGVTAELNGGTHCGLEDVSIMRSFVDMVVFEPVDETQLEQAMPQILAYEGPMYIRLARKAQPDIFGPDYQFDLFKADVVRDGTNVTIFATGIMVHESLEAAKLLAAEGISAEVINVHTMKPLDAETILASVKKTGCAVTAENHSTVGGLYSAIAELLSAEYPVIVRAIGIDHVFGQVGMMPYLMETFKMRAVDIAEAAKESVKRKG
ncbi:MAG: transketolase family protein [Oscillospiraceae bacterium]|nr:transketolase family protein [Oscillospiraceae bacterium]